MTTCPIYIARPTANWAKLSYYKQQIAAYKQRYPTHTAANAYPYFNCKWEYKTFCNH